MGRKSTHDARTNGKLMEFQQQQHSHHQNLLLYQSAVWSDAVNSEKGEERREEREGRKREREKWTNRVDVLIELEAIESRRFAGAIEAQHDDVQSRVSGRQILEQRRAVTTAAAFAHVGSHVTPLFFFFFSVNCLLQLPSFWNSSHTHTQCKGEKINSQRERPQFLPYSSLVVWRWLVGAVLLLLCVHQRNVM